MRRRLLNLLTALSLLLCMAVCVLWVRSYWVHEQVEHAGGVRYTGVASRQGQVWVRVITVGAPSWAERWEWKPTPAWEETPCRRQFAGFGFDHIPVRLARGALTGAEAIYLVPYWALALFTALPPGLWWVPRRRRQRADICLRCGYDLRATPDRCPECGTPAGVGMMAG